MTTLIQVELNVFPLKSSKSSKLTSNREPIHLKPSGRKVREENHESFKYMHISIWKSKTTKMNTLAHPQNYNNGITAQTSQPTNQLKKDTTARSNVS